ncbi:aspartate--tRNA ligase [Trifolium repens]|nr:aspartate--tRNA ligase [Trifolium repens]
MATATTAVSNLSLNEVEVQVMKLNCILSVVCYFDLILYVNVDGFHGCRLVFDMGATTNEGILCIQKHVEQVFVQFLGAKNFTKIRLNCKGILGQISPVVRAVDSFTYRHPCEFTGLDVEMEIKKHYSEVMDVVDRLFVDIFDSLNQNCKKDLKVVACGESVSTQTFKCVHDAFVE